MGNHPLALVPEQSKVEPIFETSSEANGDYVGNEDQRRVSKLEKLVAVDQ